MGWISKFAATSMELSCSSKEIIATISIIVLIVLIVRLFIVRMIISVVLILVIIVIIFSNKIGDSSN